MSENAYPRRRRAWKPALSRALRHLNFNLFNLPPSGRVTLLGTLSGAAALFLPWIEVESGSQRLSAGAFSRLSGGAGFVILPALAMLAYLAVSTRSKETLKSRLAIPFYDYTVTFFAGLFVALLSLAVFNVGVGFARTVGGDVRVDAGTSGVTFAIVGGLLACAGGALNYREKKRELLHMIHLENLAQKESDYDSYAALLGKPAAAASDRNNMSLPV